jgi:energy-converting hydrogenase Eha subunit A
VTPEKLSFSWAMANVMPQPAIAAGVTRDINVQMIPM